MSFGNDWRTIAGMVGACVVLCFFLSARGYAQVAGATLSGSVADESGSVIVNAKIAVQDVAT